MCRGVHTSKCVQTRASVHAWACGCTRVSVRAHPCLASCTHSGPIPPPAIGHPSLTHSRILWFAQAAGGRKRPSVAGRGHVGRPRQRQCVSEWQQRTEGSLCCDPCPLGCSGLGRWRGAGVLGLLPLPPLGPCWAASPPLRWDEVLGPQVPDMGRSILGLWAQAPEVVALLALAQARASPGGVLRPWGPVGTPQTRPCLGFPSSPSAFGGPA